MGIAALHPSTGSKGFTLADPANRAIVCQPCNEDKGSRSLASFLFCLRRAADPRAPFVAAFLERGSADVHEIEPTSIEVPCFFWGVAPNLRLSPTD